MTPNSFMFDRFNNRVTLSGTLTTEMSLRIGAGRGTELTGADLPVVRDSFHRPYIPGSSFKGALRAFIEALVRGVKDTPKAACNPVKEKDWCIPSAEGWKDGKIEEELCL